MKPETRLAILEAFASSKPREFDGFTLEYLALHPEPLEPEITVLPIVEEAPKTPRKRKVVGVSESE